MYSLHIDAKNSLISKKDLKPINKKLKASLKNPRKLSFEFSRLPDDKKTADEILKHIKNLKYNNVIVIGIGGAILGGKTLVHALRSENSPKFTFINNIDPDYFSESLAGADLKNSVFVIASKSGDTAETIANFMALKSLLGKKKINYKKKTIIITENNANLLNKIAKKENIKCFYVSEKISGRFSVLGPMGLIPAATAKINIKNILIGAKKIKKICAENSEKNPAALLAKLQYLAYLKHKKPITVIFPYSTKLNSFADWYIQLLSESLGKTENIGPTPIKAIGATDQHSELQLFMEGPNNKFIIFIEIEKFKNNIKIDGKDLENSTLSYLKNKSLSDLLNAEKCAIAEALKKQKRPNITIKINSLDEENLGALLYLFEMQIALLGILFKVNPFNQPGVELSKKLTKKYLSNAKN